MIKEISIYKLTTGLLHATVNPHDHYASKCEKIGDEWVCDHGCKHKIKGVDSVQCGTGESYTTLEEAAHREGRSYQFYKDFG